MTKFFGISFKLRASVEVMILFLSGSIPGKKLGLEPVAIITFLVSIFEDLLPSIWIFVASINEPVP